MQNAGVSGEIPAEVARARPAMDRDAHVEPPAAMPVVEGPGNILGNEAAIEEHQQDRGAAERDVGAHNPPDPKDHQVAPQNE